MRKGFVPANTIFAIVLIIIFILAVGQLFYYFLHRETTMEYFLSDIYVVKNGINLANLYLENSLDYSVYQAMYDNGLRGGWKEIPAGYAYDENLSYWVETGGVITPSRKDLNDSLKSAITENLNKYVGGGYSFLSKYYTLPTFKADQIIISDLDGETGISASSDKTIRFHDVIEHKTGEERISIESTPRLGNTYSLDYFDLYGNSSGVFNEMKTKNCTGLSKDDKLRDNEKDNNYVINVVVVDKKDTPCEATLKINVTDSNARFPVFNGKEITFESVSMVFLVKIG